MFHLIALVVVLSILAHSSTDVPIAHYFARQRARQRQPGPEQTTLEGEITGTSSNGFSAGEHDT